MQLQNPSQTAIDQAYSLLKTDREAVRAAHWNRLPISVRRVAVMCANLPKERADDTLNKFTALERGVINLKVQRLVRDLEIVTKAMQGGDIAAPSERDFH